MTKPIKSLSTIPLDYEKQVERELAKHGFYLENWRRAARKNKSKLK